MGWKVIFPWLALFALATGCETGNVFEIPPGLKSDAVKYHGRYKSGEFLNEDCSVPVWSHELKVKIVAFDHNYYGFAVKDPNFSRTWIVASGKFSIYEFGEDDLLFVIIDPVYYDLVLRSKVEPDR